jgi:hypothetical protein
LSDTEKPFLKFAWEGFLFVSYHQIIYIGHGDMSLRWNPIVAIAMAGMLAMDSKVCQAFKFKLYEAPSTNLVGRII